MTFDWDPAKNDQNLAQRGFDFAFAVLVFAGAYVEFDDTRRDYGEHRVIKARVGSRKERRRYAESLEAIRAQDDPDAGPR